MPREVTGLSGSPCWKMPWRDEEKEPEQPPLVASSEKRAKQLTAVLQGESWPLSIRLPSIMALPASEKLCSLEADPSPNTNFVCQ